MGHFIVLTRKTADPDHNIISIEYYDWIQILDLADMFGWEREGSIVSNDWVENYWVDKMMEYSDLVDALDEEGMYWEAKQINPPKYPGVQLGNYVSHQVEYEFVKPSDVKKLSMALKAFLAVVNTPFWNHIELWFNKYKDVVDQYASFEDLGEFEIEDRETFRILNWYSNKNGQQIIQAFVEFANKDGIYISQEFKVHGNLITNQNGGPYFRDTF